MQIIPLPVLNAGGEPDTRSLTPGVEGAVKSKEITFASALALIHGNDPDDPPVAEQNVDAVLDPEDMATDTSDSQAEFAEAAETDDLEDPATNAETLNLEQDLQDIQEFKPERLATDRTDGLNNAHGETLRQVPDSSHSIDSHVVEVDEYRRPPAEVKPDVVQPISLSRTSVGMDETTAQVARAPESIPDIGRPTGEAWHTTAREGNVAALADTKWQPSERHAKAEGIFNALWAAAPVDNAVRLATQGKVILAESKLPGAVQATDSKTEPSPIALFEPETPVASPAKTTVRAGAVQSQEQISNPLVGGPAGITSMIPQPDTTPFDTLLSAEASPDVNAPRPAGAAGITLSVASEGLLARPEMARTAAAYAVEILSRDPGKMVEIALNPEELGRVRMALSPSDVGVTVSITSERPETLELMRRHIEQLSQEFQKLGYEQTSFEFTSEGSGGDDQTQKGGHAGADIGGVAAEQTNNIPNRLIQTGLDLRL